MAETQLNILVRVEGAKESAVAIQQVGTSTAQVGKHTEEANKKTSQLGSTLKTLAGGFLVYKGAEYIKKAVTSTNELARQTYALQKITGMDATTSAGWIALAKERGIQTTKLNMGFITLAKQSQKLSEGNKTATEAFARLGIAQKQWEGLNTQQRMELLATQFQKMRNPMERAALAQTLFGRSAQAMIPLLSKGRDAVHSQVAEMGKASGVTNKSVQDQMKLVVAQRQLHMAMLALSMGIAQALAPVLLGLSKVLVPLTGTFAKAMQNSAVFRYAILGLTVALTALIIAVKLLRTQTELETIASKLAAAATWLWNTAMAANPIGLVVIAIVALIAVFVVLWTKVKWFREAVTEVWDWIKSNWPLLVGIILLPFVGPIGIIVALFHKQLIGAAQAAFGAVKGAAEAVFRWIVANWPLLLSILTGPIGAAVIQIIKHWKEIEQGAEALAKGIASFFAGIGTSIAGAVKTAINSGIIEPLNSLLHAAHELYKKIPDPLGTLPSWPLPDPAISSMQTGGWMSHAGTALVGEHGPEMVHLPQGARVSPFVQSYGGGAGNVTVRVPLYLDSRQIGLAMGTFAADMKATR
jgi:hypothetical protein